MPESVYTRQVTWLDHIRAHPREQPLDAAGIVIGIAFILATFIPWWPGSHTVAIIPVVAAWTLGGFLILGGAVTLGATLGLYIPCPRGARPPDLSRRWLVEQLGLSITVCGWTLYLVLLWLYYKETVINVAPPAAFLLGAALRIWSLADLQRQVDESQKRGRAR